MPHDKRKLPKDDVPHSDQRELLQALSAIREKMSGDAGPGLVDQLRLHPSYRDSARNFLAYLCLRRRDLRSLQMQLAELGLSSLAGCEAYALSAVTHVVAALAALTGQAEPNTAPGTDTGPGLKRGRDLLRQHTKALLGAPPSERQVRIMVTLPEEAAHEPDLVRDMIANGMDCARVNCAHGDADSWRQMIANVRNGAEQLGRNCQVVMDLAGPKLRTGPIQPAPEVLKIKPERDAFGHVTKPARLRLTIPDAVMRKGDPSAWAVLPRDWLVDIGPSDVLRFRDARGSKRRLRVTESDADGCWVEADRTAYLTVGTKLKARGKKLPAAQVLAVSQPEPHIELEEGDILVLERNTLGRPAQRDDEGRVTAPAVIGCDVAELFSDVQPGQAILFDDGKITGRINKVEDETMEVGIEHVAHASGRGKLRSDKGINLPDTDLRLGALTKDDLDALHLAAEHADGVELSFANTVEDVTALLTHLQDMGAEDMGVVLKIETKKAFINLPSMILAGMQLGRFGVMIARGDLAVETGFERLAEVQEEILCLCEAAHVPVIWATQVLENLAKKGTPSRAEITDAGLGVRAECVMLNKGPYILAAVRTLDDLLKRMNGHRNKNRGMMRKLNVAAVPANVMGLRDS